MLYVCSSGFVVRNGEVDFVRSWIQGLRDRGGRVAEAGFLIRPHPLNAAQWADADLDGDQVRVYYGAADGVVAVADLSLAEILSGLADP